MNMLIPKTKAQNDCLNNSFLMVICNDDLLLPQGVSRNSAFLGYLQGHNSQKNIFPEFRRPCNALQQYNEENIAHTRDTESLKVCG